MRQKKKRLVLICFLLFIGVLSGCSNLEGIQKKSREEDRIVARDEIYTTLEEPQGIIKNYAGMVEDESVDWVWLKPGTKFGNYRSVAVALAKNFSLATVPGLPELLTEQINSLLQSSGLTVAREGEMVLDGAIVDITLKEGIVEKIGKILPGDLEDKGVTVCAEVTIGDTATNIILCKIRHQATAADLESAVKKIADDVVRYINLHR